MSEQFSERFIVLFGSCARGDDNAFSDVDVLRINARCLSSSKLVPKRKRVVNYVDYDAETFNVLYNGGSLFLAHIFNEGILLEGNPRSWEFLKEQFHVTTCFSGEFAKIESTLSQFRNPRVFGGHYLSALAALFTIVKNSSIFFLAQNKVYEFNKCRSIYQVAEMMCFDSTPIVDLRLFYDRAIRELPVTLPYSPRDKSRCEEIIKCGHNMVRRICEAA